MEDDGQINPNVDPNHREESQEVSVPEPLEAVEAELEGRPYPPEALQRIVSVSRTRSAPLPAPEEFGQYEEILPGSADRILSMSERALEAQTAAIQRESKAEATAIEWVSKSFALSLPVSMVIVIVGALTESTAAIVVGGIVGVMQVAPKFLSAIRGRDLSTPDAEPERD